MKKLLLAAALVCTLAAQNINIRTATAAIAGSGTISSPVYTGEYVPVALVMPAAFTGTSVTFQGSADGQTYSQIYVGGSAYTETVAAGKYISLTGSAFAGAEWIRVVSGSSEGADRLVVVVMRRGAR